MTLEELILIRRILNYPKLIPDSPVIKAREIVNREIILKTTDFVTGKIINIEPPEGY